MALWAYVDVNVAIKEFQSIWLRKSAWYFLQFKLYKHVQSKIYTALVLNSHEHSKDGIKRVTDNLEPSIKHMPLDDAYVTRPFFVKDNLHKVYPNEVACFRAEIPALPAIMNRAAWFLEVQLIELLLDESTLESGSHQSKNKVSVTGHRVMDSKIIRIANMAADKHEYIPCNFDDGHYNAVAHIIIDSALLKIGVAKPMAQELSERPCSRYKEWMHIIGSSRSNQLKSWFTQPNIQEELFYNTPETTEYVMVYKTADSHHRDKRRVNLQTTMVNRFMQQVINDNHGCGELFGIFIEPKGRKKIVTRNTPQKEIAIHDHHLISLVQQSLMYISAKIIATNAVSIARREHTCNTHHEVNSSFALDKVCDVAIQLQEVTCVQATNEESTDQCNMSSTIDSTEDRITTSSQQCPFIDQSIFISNAIITFENGHPQSVYDEAPLEASQDLLQPVANDAFHIDTCQRLNRLMDKLGIHKRGNDKVAIKVQHGITLIFNEIKLDSTSMERKMNQLVAGICTWLCLVWNHLNESYKQEKGSLDPVIRAYCTAQHMFFTKTSQQWVNEAAMIVLLRKLNFTDEHHFFIANCFPFVRRVRQVPASSKIPLPQLEESDVHLVVLVHGYNSAPITMAFIRNVICAFTKGTDVLFSSCLMDSDIIIEKQGLMLAKDVDAHIRRHIGVHNLKRLSFIGHSLGGVVVRAALRYLQRYEDVFYAFISYCCPHIGVPMSLYRFVGTGGYFLASYIKSPCISQLLMSDSNKLEDSYIYRLSGDDCINKFRYVKLVGIIQDYISPATSCLLDTSLTNVKCTSVELLCQRLTNNLQSAILDKLTVDYSKATKFVRWKALGAHLHIISTSLLARYFFYMTFDIF